MEQRCIYAKATSRRTTMQSSDREQRRSRGDSLNLTPINIPRNRSLSMSKTTFSSISKSCPYTNLREIGLKMSQEITCSSARLHLLSPVHTAVFRGKEAVCWLRSKGHKELSSLGKGNGPKHIAATPLLAQGHKRRHPGTKFRGGLAGYLELDAARKPSFPRRWRGGLLKIPNPMHQIKSAGRKTPVKRNSSSSPSISSPMSKSVSSPSSYSQINTSVNKLQFIDSSKALYRFNDALIADRHVHVIVHYAESLIGKSKDGTSSPFVRLELGRQRAETKVVSKNLNAKWEEHFIFGMVEREELTSSLRISVWDSHVGRSAFWVKRLYILGVTARSACHLFRKQTSGDTQKKALARHRHA